MTSMMMYKMHTGMVPVPLKCTLNMRLNSFKLHGWL